METRICALNLHPGSMVVLTLAWFSLFGISASAQLGNGAKVQRQEMDKRELQLSDVGRGRKEIDSKRAQAIRAQLNEDFQRILKLHNEMVRAIASNGPLDYQSVSEATGEINKRAIRVQSTLALTKPESSEQNPQFQDLAKLQTRDSLIKLCREIELFVKNPIIETPGTVDAEQLELARRHLDGVVQLSSAIKKSAQRQKKLH